MVATFQSVEGLIASIPVLDEKMLPRLRNDIVTQIHNYDTIAKRYGLVDETGLLNFLQANPRFAQEVAQLRALMAGDMSSQDRCRLKGAIASEELVAVLYEIAMNQANSAAVRIDAVKQANRMGGIDGLQPASREGAAAGTPFNINFHFSSGMQAIATTVVAEIENALPAPAA